jgi:hypothetical protein
MKQKHQHNPVVSTSAKVAVVQSVNNTIDPPPYLSAKEIVHFNNIVGEFTKSEMNPMRVELCGILANTMQRRLDEMRLLRKEGSVILGVRRNPITNPRTTVIARLNSDIVKLRTHLLADGRVSVVERKTRAMNKRVEAQAEATFNSPSASLLTGGVNGAS